MVRGEYLVQREGIFYSIHHTEPRESSYVRGLSGTVTH